MKKPFLFDDDVIQLDAEFLFIPIFFSFFLRTRGWKRMISLVWKVDGCAQQPFTARTRLSIWTLSPDSI